MPKQLAFVIDLKRCIGCDTCMLGCKMENSVADGKFRLRVVDSNQEEILKKPKGAYPNLSQYWVPIMCHQCVEAPCVQACPTNTLWRRDEDGLIMLDKDKCIGCQRCGEECPYDALSFSDDMGTADKCTACSHRLDNPAGPMCAMVCPTRAIHFGDVADPASRVSALLSDKPHQKLRESSGANPQIYYLEP